MCFYETHNRIFFHLTHFWDTYAAFAVRFTLLIQNLRLVITVFSLASIKYRLVVVTRSYRKRSAICQRKCMYVCLKSSCQLKGPLKNEMSWNQIVLFTQNISKLFFFSFDNVDFLM